MDAIFIYSFFDTLLVLLLCFILIPTYSCRRRLLNSLTKFLESHTKDSDKSDK